MNCSRSPRSPPSTKCLNLRVLKPPVGEESLNGQRKLEAWVFGIWLVETKDGEGGVGGGGCAGYGEGRE